MVPVIIEGLKNLKGKQRKYSSRY